MANPFPKRKIAFLKNQLKTNEVQIVSRLLFSAN